MNAVTRRELPEYAVETLLDKLRDRLLFAQFSLSRITGLTDDAYTQLERAKMDLFDAQEYLSACFKACAHCKCVMLKSELGVDGRCLCGAQCAENEDKWVEQRREPR